MPKRNKFFWAGAAVLAALLFVLVNSVATLIVLVTVIVTPLLSIAIMLPEAKKVSLSIEAPEACSASDTIDGRIIVSYGGVLPISSVYAVVACKNAFIGETRDDQICLSLHRGESTFTYHVDTECCGQMHISLANAVITDAFGIFERKLALPEERIVMVMPEAAALALDVSTEFSMLVDSDHYSMTRPGNDPSETFAMREYRAGDPIRSIHWKMSEKTGKLMVRELGLPIVNQIVLIFEAAVIDPHELPSPQVVEAMASTFLSASAALVEEDVKHTLCWRRAGSGALVIAEVEGRRGLAEARAAFLDNAVGRCSETTPARFHEDIGPCPYAHVVVVSSYVEPDLELLYNSNRVTVIAFAGGARDAGTGTVIATTPATYREDLREFEV